MPCRNVRVCFLALLAGLLAGGCSGPGRDDRNPPETTTLESINQHSADHAVGALRQPLTKARGAQDMAAQHVRDLDREQP